MFHDPAGIPVNLRLQNPLSIIHKNLPER
jgi:hypothetical protein